MKLLLCCMKSKPYLLQGFAKPFHTKDENNPFNYNWSLIDKQTSNTLNGKIIGECDFEIEEIKPFFCEDVIKFEKDSCLTMLECVRYLNGINGYAIHLKNLHIFTTPKNLNSCLYVKKEDEDSLRGFFNPQAEGYLFKPVKTVPKNMRKVWFPKSCELLPYILMSVEPKDLVKILSGEKKIELRRTVLKEMIK